MLLGSLSTCLSCLTVDSASFDLLTKPQPTKDPCLLREAYSPSRIPTLLWSLGVGREFHFPRPPTIVSTQWNRYGSQLFLGIFRRKPATRCFDESFAPRPRYATDLHVRNAYEPPPKFPLASPNPGLGQYLSGPSITTPTPFRRGSECVSANHIRFVVPIDKSTTCNNTRLLSSCFKTSSRHPPCLEGSAPQQRTPSTPSHLYSARLLHQAE